MALYDGIVIVLVVCMMFSFIKKLEAITKDKGDDK